MTEHHNETEQLDPETERTRLEAVEQYFEHVRDTTPYYEWLSFEWETVERGFVRLRIPHGERVQPPEVAPDAGLNGGVLVTLVDAAGMAAIIAEALEPIGLATTNLSVTFHDGIKQDHVFEAETVDFGNTLATAEVSVVPASDVDDPDRKVVASGRASARLFG